jgi:type I restriction enzyme S subunit
MKTKTKFKQTEIGMIPEDWETGILSDHIEIIGGGTPKTTVDEYWNGDIPWISVVDFVGGKRWIYDTEKHIMKKGLENSSTKLLRSGQIIISARGTVGELSQVTRDMAFNQSCYGINGKKDLSNDYLYYLLKHKVKEFQQKGHGAVFNTITTKTFSQVVIPLLDLQEQSAITKILSDLDSKIELNQQMNKTLEEMGKAIFKHWFIDFEFPSEDGKPYKSSGGEMVYNKELGRELPKGWTFIPLDQAAEFTRGFSYRGSEKSKTDGEYAFVTLNSVKEFGGFKREFSYITTDRAKEKHFVHRGDIVVANTEQTKTGTLLGCPALVEFPLGYEKDKGIFSHHITKVMPKLKNLKHYLYYHLFINQQNAVKYNTGSVIWALDVSNWSKNEKIILPDQKTLQKFELAMETIFQKSLENNLQIETLSRLRDSLLPKLMSGKIRVPVEVR